LKKEVTIIAEEYELTAESLNDLDDFIQDKGQLVDEYKNVHVTYL
jgi:hypothetical protein